MTTFLVRATVLMLVVLLVLIIGFNVEFIRRVELISAKLDGITLPMGELKKQLRDLNTELRDRRD